jgi:hypothetical protein
MMESVYCDFSKLPTDPGNWFWLTSKTNFII